MDTTRRKTRIMALSHALIWLFVILAILHPLLVLAVTTTMSDAQLMFQVLGRVPPDAELAVSTRALVAGLSILPALILSLGLLSLYPALGQMRAGRAFAGAAFKGLRRFALAMVASTAAKIAIVPLISLLITRHLAETSVTLALGLEDLRTLVLAAAVWLLAWVMAEGHALASENAQFV